MIFGFILFVLLAISMHKTFSLMYHSAKKDKQDIIKEIERGQRLSQATAHEAINAIFLKISVRPNRHMNRQAKHLSELVFDERDIQEIIKEQWFYKIKEEEEVKGKTFQGTF